MKAKRSCKIKNKSLTLKADCDVFARLLVVSGKRNICLKGVLKYSLGPFCPLFYGIGKKKIYKLVKGSERYQETLAQLGESFTFDPELFPSLQEMVAECYGLTKTNDIDEARYQKFCSKTNIPEPQQLPPTKDELYLHFQ